MHLNRAVRSFVEAARIRKSGSGDLRAVLRATLLLHTMQKVSPDAFVDKDQYLEGVHSAVDDALAR